jgi:hypothetical protein
MRRRSGGGGAGSTSGRKNWLTVGSPRGGQTAAVLFSFTSTCQRLGVEPWAYLQDVLKRLPTMPAEQLSDLLSDRWQVARQDCEGALAGARHRNRLGAKVTPVQQGQ